MTRLVRLYIRQVLAGMALGIAFTVVLVLADVAGLRDLVTGVEGGHLAFWLLAFFNGLVFAGGGFAITILRLADKDSSEK